MDEVPVIKGFPEDRLAPLWEGAAQLGVSLTDEQRQRFLRYAEELLFWNAKMNLISLKHDLDIPIRHFLDSLTPLPYLGAQTASVLDIGAGAGFPGLPLKISCPTLAVYLLEASRKKTSFLRQVIRTLGLAEVHVVHGRAEVLRTDDAMSGRYDCVISRATWKLPDFVAMGSAFLRRGGCLVSMKGVEFREELDAAAPVATRIGLDPPEVREFCLPITGEGRTLIIYRKVKAT